jgi:hypothetical protein
MCTLTDKHVDTKINKSVPRGLHLLGSALPDHILVEAFAYVLGSGKILPQIRAAPSFFPRSFLPSATTTSSAAAGDADDVKVGMERRTRRHVHGDAAAVPVVAGRGARPDGLPEGGVPGPRGGVEEIGSDAADLDEGALERREEVGVEEVGSAAAGAEVERLVAAGAGGRGGGRGPVREEDVHVLGAARAVGLRADAARLGLVGGGGRAAPRG